MNEGTARGLHRGRPQGRGSAGARWRQGLVCALLLGLAAVLLAACGESAAIPAQSKCDKLLDEAAWDDAITVCGAIATDEGRSKTAQAYMGRAGVSLLDLMDKLQNSSLGGLALVLNVRPSPLPATFYADLTEAVRIMSQDIVVRTNTDNFNLVLASDMALTSLFTDSLGVSVDASGAVVIPGITDANLSALSTSSTPPEVQTAFQAIYGGTYYQTAPLPWDSGSATAPDLAKISLFVQANRLGGDAFGLSTDPKLATLDFADAIDNGHCGYAAGTNPAPTDTTTPATDPAAVAAQFPRRLNTSDPTANYLADGLNYVLSGGTPEWGTSFLLPSALLNPDFLKVECDGDATASLGEFGACMSSGTTALSSLALGQTNSLDTSLTTTSGGTGNLCAGATCTMWPLLVIDGNPVTDESVANGATAAAELADVLDALYPIDNSADPSATGFTGAAGVPCRADDGWAHAREYDYYLRTFGQ